MTLEVSMHVSHASNRCWLESRCGVANLCQSCISSATRCFACAPIYNNQSPKRPRQPQQKAFPGETRVHSLRKQLIFKSTHRAIAHSIFCSSSRGKRRRERRRKTYEIWDAVQRSMLAVRLAARKKLHGGTSDSSIIWHFIRLNQRAVQKAKRRVI
jgi:hypothetical protein